jgi:hypothetical protein
MFYAGVCWLCEAGLIGVRACGRCAQLSLLCDECDSLWTDANISASPGVVGSDQLPCPYCGASLYDDPAGETPAHWATQQEIDGSPWLATALLAGSLTLCDFPGGESAS